MPSWMSIMVWLVLSLHLAAMATLFARSIPPPAFRMCRACHSLEAGVNRVGPTLHKVFGRTAGTVEGYHYSEVMAQSGIVWDHTTLQRFLTRPRTYLPGTTMAFAGIADSEALDDLLAYLYVETEGQAE